MTQEEAPGSDKFLVLIGSEVSSTLLLMSDTQSHLALLLVTVVASNMAGPATSGARSESMVSWHCVIDTRPTSTPALFATTVRLLWKLWHTLFGVSSSLSYRIRFYLSRCAWHSKWLPGGLDIRVDPLGQVTGRHVARKFTV